MRLQRAFTLMELLVVLLIIGILSTVALRTIDATRDRGLFDQTAKELNELVQAMTGNPALSYDGRRVDFGFYGDMGRLPNDPRELVTNTTGDTNWHGPYIRRGLAGDSLGYLYDAWGDVYTYSSGTISSLGNGKYPMTVSVADSMQLRHNTISGTVTDRDNSPPADTTMRIALYTSSDTGNAQVHVSTSGSYTIRNVPIGTHRLASYWGAPVAVDSIVRWVTVSPRSAPVVDFRFSRTFSNRLVLSGPRDTTTSDGFYFYVENQGPSDDTVRSFKFLYISDAIYLHRLAVRGVYDTTYAPADGKTVNDDAFFRTPVVVGPNRTDQVLFQLELFTSDSLGLVPYQAVKGKTFRILFDDGSDITVIP